jgi:hypothetical protein
MCLPAVPYSASVTAYGYSRFGWGGRWTGVTTGLRGREGNAGVEQLVNTSTVQTTQSIDDPCYKYPQADKLLNLQGMETGLDAECAL